jgi:hypothetical protein
MHSVWHQGTRQALLGLAACAALAAEAPQIGFQAVGSWPTGSMRSEFTRDNGYGVGVYGGWEAAPGKVVRLAWDGIWYSGSAQAPGAGIPAGDLVAVDDRKSRSHLVTLQYLLFPSGDDEGVYYKVGLGAMNCLTRGRATALFQNGQRATVDVVDETGTKLATVAGIGYEFGRNWGVLAQYSFITVNNRTLGAVQAGISYRF